MNRVVVWTIYAMVLSESKQQYLAAIREYRRAWHPDMPLGDTAELALEAQKIVHAAIGAENLFPKDRLEQERQAQQWLEENKTTYMDQLKVESEALEKKIKDKEDVIAEIRKTGMFSDAKHRRKLKGLKDRLEDIQKILSNFV